MTWTDVVFPPVELTLGEHHAGAAIGNAAVADHAISALTSALTSTPEPGIGITHLLLRAAAGAGKSYALVRLIVAAAGAPATRRLGVAAFTNNQIRPLALRLAEKLGRDRVCLHLSADAYAKLSDDILKKVTVTTKASQIPETADVIVATASKLKAPGEIGRLTEHLGPSPGGRLFHVLFVDEAWQLPHHLFDPIERAAPVVVGVGDVGQLPPLEAGANPWRGDRTHNPYRAWPPTVEGRPTTWSEALPTVWRPPGEAVGLWRAFYPSWGETLQSVAAPGDRRLVPDGSGAVTALWEHIGGGVPTLVEVDGLPDSDAPDVDLPLLDQVEGWLDDLFAVGFQLETATYSDAGIPDSGVSVDRPGLSDDGDPLVVVLATRNQLVDDATAMVERLRTKYDLRDRDLVASTVDSWQGRTNGVTVALHPLSGATALDDFNSAFGRLAVACTRATHGLLLVARSGLDDLLGVAPPRPGTPIGEPGERQLPRQTHQRILGAFARVRWAANIDHQHTYEEPDVATV